MNIQVLTFSYICHASIIPEYSNFKSSSTSLIISLTFQFSMGEAFLWFQLHHSFCHHIEQIPYLLMFCYNFFSVDKKAKIKSKVKRKNINVFDRFITVRICIGKVQKHPERGVPFSVNNRTYLAELVRLFTNYSSYLLLVLHI